MFDNLILYLGLFPCLAYGLAAGCGLVLGSFLTFLFYRIKAREPWLWGKEAARSRCPSCHTTLKARDLIPILSWVMARGQCRYCGQKISTRYPLIEITSAVVFMIILYLFR